MTIADLEQAARTVVDNIIQRTLGRLPLSPSALTVTGMLLNIVVVILLARGHLAGAAIMMLLAASFDMIDGPIARSSGQQSAQGAFLDATMDRYSETLVGLGLWLYLLQQGTPLEQLLLYLFITGSFLFSYTKARAEAQGLKSGHGLFTRPLRVCLLGLALLAGRLHLALWVLSLGVWAGAIYRLLSVFALAQLRRPAKETPTWQQHFAHLSKHFPLKK